MGLMRFLAFPADRLTDDMAQQAYLSGLDRIPWKVQPRLENGQLILQRGADDSARYLEHLAREVIERRRNLGRRDK